MKKYSKKQLAQIHLGLCRLCDPCEKDLKKWHAEKLRQDRQKSKK